MALFASMTTNQKDSYLFQKMGQTWILKFKIF